MNSKFNAIALFISFIFHLLIFIPYEVVHRPSEILLKKSIGVKIVKTVHRNSILSEKGPAIKKKKVEKSNENNTSVEITAIQIGDISPKYPYKSRIFKEAGTVRLRVMINEKGVVEEVVILKSSGYKRLDDEARATLNLAKFIPAKMNDKNISSTKEMSFTFKLK